MPFQEIWSLRKRLSSPSLSRALAVESTMYKKTFPASYFFVLSLSHPLGLSSVTRYQSKNLSQMFPKVAQINTTEVFTSDDRFQNIFQGYFCKQICCQNLSKIAQSGHTGSIYLFLFYTHPLSFSFTRSSFLSFSLLLFFKVFLFLYISYTDV